MDSTHFHLAFTHFPIVSAFIGTVLFAVGLVKNNMTLKRTALLTFVAVALISIPVYLTGEEAEETIEHLPGVSEQVIEEHEEFAELSIWLIGLLGVSALVSLMVINKATPPVKVMLIITFILALTTSAAMVQLGNSGGQIRHSEIREDGLNFENADHKHDD